MERYSYSKEINKNLKKVESLKNNKTHISKNENEFKIKELKKITLYILTRDYRTSDNLTLYGAYDESIKSDTNFCILFRFHPDQIFEERNPYYSSNAVQFMIEALEILSKEINYTWIEPISDEKFSEFLSSLPIDCIFIARDFTPFARKRFEFLSKIGKTIEVDDITAFPINQYKTYTKISPFVEDARRMRLPEPEIRKINWKKETVFLDDYINDDANFVHKGQINIKYKKNRNILANPRDLSEYLKNLAENIKGCSSKKIREQLGNPKVSFLSAYIKFGLISIRTLHTIARDLKDGSKEDILEFQRSLFSRDFFYRLAWSRSDEVFDKPNWQGKTPRFIFEEDLLKWKQNKGMKPVITKDEFKDIEEAKEIYDRWTKGETEYKLINAGINELTITGYMLNRSRMLTCSYLTQDQNLWWKYAEKFFANNLTDYDWTINSICHQNMAKIGLYPKYLQNFSIKRQENTNPKDKEKYYKKFNN